MSIADIAIACLLRNAVFVRWQPDPARWPRLTADTLGTWPPRKGVMRID